MHHGPEFTVVLVASLVLAIGAATRAFSRWTGFPYTVALLLLGIGTGIALKDVHGHEGLAGVLALLRHGTEVSPDLIIFVFLPALVFESAYGLDVHAFRKGAGVAVLLAVPAMLAAALLTGALMLWLAPEAWHWTLTFALVFGALISATDPVAVVALMRELGVSKRLATLIEGESLLNDGTAIVLFTVLLGLVTLGVDFDAGETLARFVVVVAGGLAVGLALAVAASAWLGRTFNDPLVEITLTLVLGYLAMVVAEGLLHVSGVMALVAAGLYMAGPGRTRISPEVAHFLHHFWEMLAYIANTLVFFLVGLVISIQAEKLSLPVVGVVVAAWAGIMLIRFAVTFAFQPAARAVGAPVSGQDVVVIGWGGLRGAVSMALALVVSQNPAIDPVWRESLLLATAGVVLLTLVVNGTTMGALLRRFGYDRPPLPEQMSQLSTRAGALEKVRDAVRGVARSRELRTVSWSSVEDELEARRQALHEQHETMRRQLESADPAERNAGYWLQALGIERENYWQAFAQGTLGAGTVRVLDHQIDLQLDRLEQGDDTPPESRTPRRDGLRAELDRRLRRSGLYQRLFARLDFGNLEQLYDLNRAESAAADAVRKEFEHLPDVDPDTAAAIRATYERYLRTGKERLEEIRLGLPEITQAIETRLARRIALNFERGAYEALAHHGALDETTSRRLASEVEVEMRRLQLLDRRMPLPDTADLLREIPLLSPCRAEVFERLTRAAARLVLPAGEYLCREGEQGDSLFLIARGAVHVVRQENGAETLLDVLGGGDVVGEMALLTGEPRVASIRAATPVALIQVGRDAFLEVMRAHPDLEAEVWDGFAQRRLDNFLRGRAGFEHLEHEARVSWIRGREHVCLGGGEERAVPADADHAFVVTGRVQADGARHAAPALVRVRAGTSLRADPEARLVFLPAPA